MRSAHLRIAPSGEVLSSDFCFCTPNFNRMTKTQLWKPSISFLRYVVGKNPDFMIEMIDKLIILILPFTLCHDVDFHCFQLGQWVYWLSSWSRLRYCQLHLFLRWQMAAQLSQDLLLCRWSSRSSGSLTPNWIRRGHCILLTMTDNRTLLNVGDSNVRRLCTCTSRWNIYVGHWNLYWHSSRNRVRYLSWNHWILLLQYSRLSYNYLAVKHILIRIWILLIRICGYVLLLGNLLVDHGLGVLYHQMLRHRYCYTSSTWWCLMYNLKTIR